MSRSEKKRFSRAYSLSVVILIAGLFLFQISYFLFKNEVRDTYTVPVETPQETPLMEREQSSDKDSTKPLKREAPQVVKPAIPAPDEISFIYFDPNLATQSEMELVGLSSAQARTVINYRSKGGVFRRAEDLRRIYTISDSLFEAIKDKIYIDTLENNYSSENEIRREKRVVDLNSADSLELVSLFGIGPYYASKIMEYRERLGGYWSTEQLMEIRGIDAQRFSELVGQIVVDTTLIKKIDLNRATIEQLNSHPYIGSYTARGIIRLRSMDNSKPIDIGELLNNRVIKENIALKLAPYLK